MTRQQQEFFTIFVSDTFVFPEGEAEIAVPHKQLLKALTFLKEQQIPLAVVCNKMDRKDLRPDMTPNDIDRYQIGSLVLIEELEDAGSVLKMTVTGVNRLTIHDLFFDDEMSVMMCHATPFPEKKMSKSRRESRKQLREILEVFSKMHDNFIDIQDFENFGIDAFPVGEVLQRLALFLELPVAEIFEAFASDSEEDMIAFFIQKMLMVGERLSLRQEIKHKVNLKLGAQERRFMIREEIKFLQEELRKLHEARQERGEDLSESDMDGFVEEGSSDIKDLEKKLTEKKFPEIVEKTMKKELSRLRRMHPSSPDSAQTRDYIEWLLDMPYFEKTQDLLDMDHARNVLDAQHYGLKKVKERILEFLAVCTLRQQVGTSQILCLVGPPGVGKTSLGKSIAEAMGRKFVHFSLAGMRDEAEIRGHRRTYVGALPGRIIQRIRRIGVNNPVFMLDEIDKIGSDFKGDPSSALLEVLDPTQNKEFNDHYLDTPFDLSDCLFITTANSVGGIPEPLLDRMEILSISGYTEEEKIHIAETFLIPRNKEACGLGDTSFNITREMLPFLIRGYTREAGLRSFDRLVASVARKMAAEYVEKKRGAKDLALASETEARRLLGPEPLSPDLVCSEPQIGIVAWLGWSPSWGNVLSLEATKMKGNGQLKLTGKLGDVMKESAQMALSYIRSHAEQLQLGEEDFQKIDVHIHAPEGAVPKDGPSAGVTIATALLSVLTRMPVKNTVAMTGELTLSGRVLGIGGLKEKSLAARRAGYTTVIIPKENERDLQEFPQELLQDITFVPVESISQVWAVAFADTLPLFADVQRSEAKKDKKSVSPRVKKSV